MSYPGGYNNPLAGHRGQFNPQQQQQMMNQMQMQYLSPQGMGPGMQQSPSHVQQQLMAQQQMQQQQQQQMGGPSQMGGMGMGHIGNPLAGGGVPQNTMGGGMMQQQPQLSPAMQQVGMQQQMQNVTNPMTNQQSSQSQQQQAQPPQTQQQQQQQQQAPTGQPQTSNNMLSTISQQPHKEINIVQLSRVGQETVQDITSRFQEIFTALKVIQPTASRDNGTVKKVQEHFRTIRLLFKRMRLIYERCSDGYPQGMEYTHVESLIPYKDDTEHRNLEATQCEEYRKALQENQELIDIVKLKNRQLREIIDRTRIIVWEINTMLSMRRS
ncbi:mediator complex subunit 30 isoform X2 [Haematobia irritans]|uniref:mediator complex subunit 30 isoform X2 n=1 Tax=Haematobia irritans TaxID=7368 RepID=UPI003F502FC6